MSSRAGRALRAVGPATFEPRPERSPHRLRNDVVEVFERRAAQRRVVPPHGPERVLEGLALQHEREEAEDVLEAARLPVASPLPVRRQLAPHGRVDGLAVDDEARVLLREGDERLAHLRRARRSARPRGRGRGRAPPVAWGSPSAPGAAAGAAPTESRGRASRPRSARSRGARGAAGPGGRRGTGRSGRAAARGGARGRAPGPRAAGGAGCLGAVGPEVRDRATSGSAEPPRPPASRRRRPSISRIRVSRSRLKFVLRDGVARRPVERLVRVDLDPSRSEAGLERFHVPLVQAPSEADRDDAQGDGQKEERAAGGREDGHRDEHDRAAQEGAELVEADVDDRLRGPLLAVRDRGVQELVAGAEERVGEDGVRGPGDDARPEPRVEDGDERGCGHGQGPEGDGAREAEGAEGGPRERALRDEPEHARAV